MANKFVDEQLSKATNKPRQYSLSSSKHELGMVLVIKQSQDKNIANVNMELYTFKLKNQPTTDYINDRLTVIYS